MLTDKLPDPVRRLLAHRRRRRVDFMLSKVAVKNGLKVIDIGCGIDGRSFDDHVPIDWEITGVDIEPPERVHHRHPGFTYLHQDAQDLSRFRDGEFDLAICIGMLEHITDESVFARIVGEMKRVARQYIAIVPYRYCWIEPHYGVPFFPLLPYSLKLALVRTLNLSNHREIVKRDPGYIRRNYRWLTNAQYHERFGDSSIYLTPTLETIAITRRAAV